MFLLVCRIVKVRFKEYFYFSLGVFVFILREEFKKYIKLFVSDIFKYGIYSMKFGVVFNLVCRKIVGDLLDIYVGWRCEFIKYRYIKYGFSECLVVFKEFLI